MPTLDYIKENIEASLSVKQALLQDEGMLQSIQRVAELCVTALKQGRQIIFAGNGGSASDAQHLAAELVGRYKLDRPGLAAIALTTDTSMLTAIANDYGYERVFERQLQANGRAGDVFFGISTSGNSKNVLLAMHCAKEMQITAVGLAGNGGAIQTLGDYCLAVPSSDTARIQECHIMIGQIICGYIEQTLFSQS